VMFPESFMISARPADRELTVMSPEWSAIVALPEIRVAWMSPESVLSVTVHPDVHHHDVGLVGSDLAQELLGIPVAASTSWPASVSSRAKALTHQHRVFGDHYPHGSTTSITVGPRSAARSSAGLSRARGSPHVGPRSTSAAVAEWNADNRRQAGRSRPARLLVAFKLPNLGQDDRSRRSGCPAPAVIQDRHAALIKERSLTAAAQQ
jgi:hypothetical protein